MSDQLIYERDSKKPIYVSTEVYRALLFLAKAGSKDADEQTGGNKLTADAVGDSIIRRTLAEKYPQIGKHFREQEKQDREIIQTLQTR